MQKLLSIFVYLILLIFLESAAEVTGVPASAPAELPEEPNYVALTFDDGPRRGTTARLLDGLRERGANATFFLVGERLAGNEDLVLRMQAEGHQVGTHTWSHIRLDGTAPAAQLRTFRQRKTQSVNSWTRIAAGCDRPTASLIRRSAPALRCLWSTGAWTLGTGKAGIRRRWSALF